MRATESEAADTGVDMDKQQCAQQCETAVTVAPLKKVSTIADNVIAEETTTETIKSNSIVSAISEADLIIYSQELEAYIAATLNQMQTTMGYRILVSQGITAANYCQINR